MSLTIELTPEHEARLAEVAALRGDRDISATIRAALDQFLEREADRRLRVDRALQREGVLSDEEAGQLQDTVRALREHWR